MNLIGSNELEIQNNENLKIEFGCGDKLTPGFVGCDVRDLPNVKYVCKAWEINKFVNSNSVQEITSRHFFEHLTFHDGSLTLKTWNKILKINGVLRICIPDMLFHIKQWISPNRKINFYPNGSQEELWAIQGFWGKQRETEIGEVWDVHKSGYDYELLKDTLEAHSFRNVRRIQDLPKNLTVECIK